MTSVLSFNISETVHVIKRLTMDIIVLLILKVLIPFRQQLVEKCVLFRVNFNRAQ